MKARRVFVTLEIETDAPLDVLRDVRRWTDTVREGEAWYCDATVEQVQVNVAKPEPKGKAKGGKK
jgi:hypothetical protein